MVKKIGIAGLGAIGSTVASALIEGIDGYHLFAVSERECTNNFGVPCVDFNTLAKTCDLIIEALPPTAVPELCSAVFKHEKDLIMISSSTAILYPEILEQNRFKQGRIIIPSGAVCGLDGIGALKQAGIKSARIASTKKPAGLKGAPYIIEHNIDLDTIKSKTKIFEGNALEAAKGFPANVNVAATLSIAGIGAEKTNVEVWADPDIIGNTHEIEVIGEYSRITSKVENTPDPANPKTSMLAAYSIIAVLKKLQSPIAII